MAKGRASPTRSGSLSVLKTSVEEGAASIPATFFRASFSIEQAPSERTRTVAAAARTRALEEHIIRNLDPTPPSSRISAGAVLVKSGRKGRKGIAARSAG